MALTPPEVIIGLLLMIVTAFGFAIWRAYHVGYADGHHNGQLEEQNRRNMRAIRAANQATPARLLTPRQASYAARHDPWAPRVTVTRTERVTMAGMTPTAYTAPLSMRHTASGELQALMAGADQYIADMQRQEAAYRRQLVS